MSAVCLQVEARVERLRQEWLSQPAEGRRGKQARAHIGRGQQHAGCVNCKPGTALFPEGVASFLCVAG